MAYWLVDKQKEATRAMIVPLNQFTDQSVEHEDSAAVVHDPNSFILYNYLKKGQNQDLSVPYDLEYNFSLNVAKAYERLGCPLLSLHILTKYRMSPPPSSPQPDEAKNEVSRAADLFSDENTAHMPSRAEDLFAQDDLFASSNAKPAYAANLFDDNDEFTIAKPSSKSLFDEKDDDLFASTSTNNKLFDSDQDIFAQETQTPSDNSEPLVDDIEDGLCAYKAMLVIRLLQVRTCLNKRVCHINRL
jgi:hypothetical protein